VSIGLLDKSISNQSIESQAFICIQILSLFHDPGLWAWAVTTALSEMATLVHGPGVS
jgi:hypothetical protein